MDLNFCFADPEDYPLASQIFSILQNNLIFSIHADEEKLPIRMVQAAGQIENLLPEGDTYNMKVIEFVELFCELAEQIPFDTHTVLHERLAQLIKMVLQSSRFARYRADGSDANRYRYRTLGDTLRDWWMGQSSISSQHDLSWTGTYNGAGSDLHGRQPDDDVEMRINFECFLACITDEGMVNYTNFLIWMLKEVFPPKPTISQRLSSTVGRMMGWLRKDEPDLEPEARFTHAWREGYVIACAMWIERCGRRLYDLVDHGGEDAIHMTSDPKGEWRRFRGEFDAIAKGAKCGRAFSWSVRCRLWAEKATRNMDEIERQWGEASDA